GVSGPDHAQIKLPSTIQTQLEAVDAIFHADDSLRAIVPDFLGVVTRTLRRLETGPVRVELVHPQTGETTFVSVGAFAPCWWLSNTVSRTWSLINLPAATVALEQGDLTPVAQFAYATRTGRVGSMMGVVTTIASGVSSERAERVRQEARETLLGDAINFPVDALSDAFPDLDSGDAYRAPIVSDVPVLMISGSLDGRTPSANAEELLDGFSNGSHLVVENASHGYDLFYFNDVVQARMRAFMRGESVRSERIGGGSFPFQVPR
ncbi:MAG: alpha/beta hydrolase, partial [Candidatus Poribacteria bacterium]|nr:alpha/beta hydrolase [Candidatus Poribacteria bacterium]